MTANRVLVTGATGFVGRWTLRHWRAAHPNVELWATSNEDSVIPEVEDRFSKLDLCHADAVRELVHECRPAHVIHLAGLVAETSLANHLAANVLGTENVYGAIVELDCYRDIRIVQAETAAIYGQVRSDELPVSEGNPFRPLTAYAISKMTQDYLAEMFWRTRELNVIRARIFNLLGPGQPEHLVPATFIKQLKTTCDVGSIRVGNLTARRDFVDVRDVVRAFDVLLTDGHSGEAYNVGSGTSVLIDDVLKELLGIAGLRNVSIEREPARERGNDVPDVVADTTLIEETVGWRPRISLRESLEAMWDAG